MMSAIQLIWSLIGVVQGYCLYTKNSGVYQPKDIRFGWKWNESSVALLDTHGGIHVYEDDGELWTTKRTDLKIVNSFEMDTEFGNMISVTDLGNTLYMLTQNQVVVYNKELYQNNLRSRPVVFQLKDSYSILKPPIMLTKLNTEIGVALYSDKIIFLNESSGSPLIGKEINFSGLDSNGYSLSTIHAICSTGDDNQLYYARNWSICSVSLVGQEFTPILCFDYTAGNDFVQLQATTDFLHRPTYCTVDRILQQVSISTDYGLFVVNLTSMIGMRVPFYNIPMTLLPHPLLPSPGLTPVNSLYPTWLYFPSAPDPHRYISCSSSSSYLPKSARRVSYPPTMQASAAYFITVVLCEGCPVLPLPPSTVAPPSLFSFFLTPSTLFEFRVEYAAIVDLRPQGEALKVKVVLPAGWESPQGRVRENLAQDLPPRAVLARAHDGFPLQVSRENGDVTKSKSGDEPYAWEGIRGGEENPDIEFWGVNRTEGVAYYNNWATKTIYAVGMEPFGFNGCVAPLETVLSSKLDIQDGFIYFLLLIENTGSSKYWRIVKMNHESSCIYHSELDITTDSLKNLKDEQLDIQLFKNLGIRYLLFGTFNEISIMQEFNGEFNGEFNFISSTISKLASPKKFKNVFIIKDTSYVAICYQEYQIDIFTLTSTILTFYKTLDYKVVTQLHKFPNSEGIWTISGTSLIHFDDSFTLDKVITDIPDLASVVLVIPNSLNESIWLMRPNLEIQGLDLIEGICPSLCYEGCATCFGRTEYQCSTCKDNYQYFYPTRSCRIICNSNEFRDKSNKCIQCHTSCNGCTGTGTDNCIKCSGGLNFLKVATVLVESEDGNPIDVNEGKCLINCPPETYLESTRSQCQLCHPSCLQCNGGKMNMCTKCRANMTLVSQKNDIGTYESGHCIDNCLQDEYMDKESLSCNKCHPDCISCTGPNSDDCLSCPIGFTITENGCAIDCAEIGYYKSEDNRNCLPCNKKCESCTGPLESQCSSCFYGTELIQSRCLSYCSEAEYRHPSALSCMKCHSLCKECFGSSVIECTSCQLNSTLIEKDNYCQPKCSEDQYPDGDNCNKCPQNCLKCENAKCSKCNNNFEIMKDGECNCNLQRGYFLMDSVCGACDERCRTCRGARSTDCETCQEGWFQLIQEDTMTCVFNCPKRYYLDYKAQACQNCSSLCYECSGPTKQDCNSCTKDLYLFKGECFDSCPEGSAISKTKIGCSTCEKGCKKCKDFDIESCIICQEGFSLYQSKCLKSCPVGTTKYSDSGVVYCKKCPTGCLECDDVSRCTECNQGLILFSGRCLEKCPEGYLEETQPSKKCTKINCSDGCDFCTISSSCKQCRQFDHSNIPIIQVGDQCYSCTKENGLNISSEGICEEICGDSILLRLNSSMHQCDIGKNVLVEGCKNCKILRGYDCIRKSSEPKTPDRCYKKTVVKSFEISKRSLNSAQEYEILFSKKLFSTAKDLLTYYELEFRQIERSGAESTTMYKADLTLGFNAVSKDQTLFRIFPSIPESVKYELNGTIRIVPKARGVLLIDVDNLLVNVSTDPVRFYYTTYVDRAQQVGLSLIGTLKMTFDSSLFQALLFIACSNPLTSQIMLGTMQKFLYYRMLELEDPPNVRNFFELTQLYMYANLAKNQPPEHAYTEQEDSAMEKFLGITSKGSEVPESFRRLGLSSFFIFTGFPSLLILGMMYFIVLMCLLARKKWGKSFMHKKNHTMIVLWKRRHAVFGSLVDFLINKLAWNGIIISFFTMQQLWSVGVFLNIRYGNVKSIGALTSLLLSLMSIPLLTVINAGIVSKIIEVYKLKKEVRNEQEQTICLNYCNEDSSSAKYFMIIKLSLKPWMMTGVAVFAGQYSAFWAMMLYLVLNLGELLIALILKPANSTFLNCKIGIDILYSILINISFIGSNLGIDQNIGVVFGWVVIGLVVSSALINISMLVFSPRLSNLV